MRAITATIADDRGQQVEVGLSRWRHALTGTRAEDGELREILTSVESWLSAPMVATRASMWLVLGAGLLFVALALIFGAMGVSVRGWMLPMVFVPIWMAVELRRRNLALSVHAESLRLTFLAASRCPSCAHSLSGCPAETDGCVVCPECGAAWHAVRIGIRGPMGQPWGYRRAVGDSGEGFLRSLSRLVPKGSITDARGRILPLRYPTLRGLPRSRSAELGTERIREARRSVLGIERKGRLLLGVMGLISAAVFVLVWPPSLIATPLPGAGSVRAILEPLMRILLPGALLMMGVTLIRSPWGVDRNRVARALLSLEICPSCAADLGARGERDAGSTLVRCPDCGAAWVQGNA